MNKRDVKKQNREIPAKEDENSDEDRGFLNKLRSPLAVIVICALLISGAAFGFSNVEKNDSGKVNPINSEYVDVNSLSDSWSCPYLSSGATENNNSIIFYNPGFKTADVSMKLNNVDGSELANKDYEIKSNEVESEAISTFGTGANVSALIESFGAPIIVYRQLRLSDGLEIIPCVKNPQDVLEFDNLVTKRNTNTTLMLSNPHNESVVVDVKARLFNTDQTPFQVQLDDLKGVVIPAFGRMDIDLQAVFGRHSIINVSVDTRSGFISGEALVDYKDGGDNEGQSIVSSSFSNLMNNTSFIFNAAPINILAQSSTTNTASVDIEALGTGNRVLNAEPQSLAIGSASPIADPGAEYGFHALKFTTNIESRKGSDLDKELGGDTLESDIPFISIVSRYLSKDKVSSYTATSNKSKEIILATRDDDTVGFLNPSDKEAKVSVSFIGTSLPSRKLTLAPNSFDFFSLNELELSGFVMLKIVANQNIVASSIRSDFGGVTSGVYLKK